MNSNKVTSINDKKDIFLKNYGFFANLDSECELNRLIIDKSSNSGKGIQHIERERGIEDVALTRDIEMFPLRGNTARENIIPPKIGKEASFVKETGMEKVTLSNAHMSNGYDKSSRTPDRGPSWTKTLGNEIRGSSSMTTSSNKSLPTRLSNNGSFASIAESISLKMITSRNSLLQTQKRTSRSGEANASWDGVNLAPKGKKEGTPSFYVTAHNTSSGNLQRMMPRKRPSFNDPPQVNGKSGTYPLIPNDVQQKRNPFLDMANSDEDFTKSLRGLMGMSPMEKSETKNGFAWPTRDELAVSVERERISSRHNKDVFICRPIEDDGEEDLIVGFPESS